LYVCKRNGNAKNLATTFSSARGPFKGGGDCGTNMAAGRGDRGTSGILQKQLILHAYFFHTSDLKYHRKNEFTKKTSSKNENGFVA
jgi:hypothetical protein